MGRLMEAARWAPSSRNLQPWRFIVATKDDPDAYEKLLAVIKEGNRHWAKNAPLLMLTITRTETDGRVNGSALHDLGLAVANLTVQATAMGLGVHQMGGIYPEVAREQYGIPDEYAIHTGIAVGYRAEPDTLPDDLAEREKQPRDRSRFPSLFTGSGRRRRRWWRTNRPAGPRARHGGRSGRASSGRGYRRTTVE